MIQNNFRINAKQNMILANMSCSVGVMLYKDESEFVFYGFVFVSPVTASHTNTHLTGEVGEQRFDVV